MSGHHVALGAVLIALCLVGAPRDARAGAAPDQSNTESAKGEVSPKPDATPAAPTSAAKRKARISDRCNTPAINCIMFDRQASGSSCWCVTPFGPSYGRVP